MGRSVWSAIQSVEGNVSCVVYCVCVCVCVFVCVKWWRVQSLGEVFSYQLGVNGYFTVCVCVCVKEDRV